MVWKFPPKTLKYNMLIYLEHIYKFLLKNIFILILAYNEKVNDIKEY